MPIHLKTSLGSNGNDRNPGTEVFLTQDSHVHTGSRQPPSADAMHRLSETTSILLKTQNF